MNVLIVDDDKLMLLALSAKLKAKGLSTLTADDGAKALEIIQKQSVDLIISDVLMPGISGLSLLNLLKQFYFNKIPLILISTLNDVDIISSSRDLGASDFMPKPIDFNNLFLKIKNFSEKRI